MDTCCLCLDKTKKSYINVFENNERNLLQAYFEKLVSTFCSTYPKDKPFLVCQDCGDEVENIHKFNQKCLKNVRQFFENDESLAILLKKDDIEIKKPKNDEFLLPVFNLEDKNDKTEEQAETKTETVTVTELEPVSKTEKTNTETTENVSKTTDITEPVSETEKTVTETFENISKTTDVTEPVSETEKTVTETIENISKTTEITETVSEHETDESKTKTTTTVELWNNMEDEFLTILNPNESSEGAQSLGSEILEPSEKFAVCKFLKRSKFLKYEYEPDQLDPKSDGEGQKVETEVPFEETLIKTDQNLDVTEEIGDVLEESNLIEENLGRTKRFSCKVCHKRFLRKGNLETHLKFHTGLQLFNCPKCNKKFTENKYLTLHLRGHKDIEISKEPVTKFGKRKSKGPFVCKKCNRTFVYINHYVRHKRAHKNKKRGFPKLESTDSDATSEQPTKKIKIDTEANLSGSGENSENLSEAPENSSVSTFPVLEGTAYACKICNQVLSHKRYLGTHMRKHRDIVKYVPKRRKFGEKRVTRGKSCNFEKFFKNETGIGTPTSENSLDVALKLLEAEGTDFGNVDDKKSGFESIEKSNIGTEATFGPENSTFGANNSNFDLNDSTFGAENSGFDVENASFGAELSGSESDDLNLETDPDILKFLQTEPSELEKNSTETETETLGLVRPIRICRICNKVFRKKKFFLLHMKNAHSNNQNKSKPYPCLKCNKSFELLRMFKRHNTMVHGVTAEIGNSSDNKIEPNITTEPDTENLMKNDPDTNENLNTIGTETKNPPSSQTTSFQDIFIQQTALASKTETSSIRNRRTTNSSTDPMKIDSNSEISESIKSRTCHICNRVFIRKSNLESHLKTHTGIAMIKCPKCDRRFTEKKFLTMHYKTHRGSRFTKKKRVAKWKVESFNADPDSLTSEKGESPSHNVSLPEGSTEEMSETQKVKVEEGSQIDSDDLKVEKGPSPNTEGNTQTLSTELSSGNDVKLLETSSSNDLKVEKGAAISTEVDLVDIEMSETGEIEQTPVVASLASKIESSNDLKETCGNEASSKEGLSAVALANVVEISKPQEVEEIDSNKNGASSKEGLLKETVDLPLPNVTSTDIKTSLTQEKNKDKSKIVTGSKIEQICKKILNVANSNSNSNSNRSEALREPSVSQEKTPIGSKIEQIAKNIQIQNETISSNSSGLPGVVPIDPKIQVSSDKVTPSVSIDSKVTPSSSREGLPKPHSELPQGHKGESKIVDKSCEKGSQNDKKSSATEELLKLYPELSLVKKIEPKIESSKTPLVASNSSRAELPKPITNLPLLNKTGTGTGTETQGKVSDKVLLASKIDPNDKKGVPSTSRVDVTKSGTNISSVNLKVSSNPEASETALKRKIPKAGPLCWKKSLNISQKSPQKVGPTKSDSQNRNASATTTTTTESQRRISVIDLPIKNTLVIKSGPNSEKTVETSKSNVTNVPREKQEISKNNVPKVKNSSVSTKNISVPSKPVSEPFKNISGPSKHFSEHSKNIAETSRSFTEPLQTFSEPPKNIFEPTKNVSDPKNTTELYKHLSEPSNNITVTSKNYSETSKNISAASKNITESSKTSINVAEPSRNLNEPTKNISDPSNFSGAFKNVSEPSKTFSEPSKSSSETFKNSSGASVSVVEPSRSIAEASNFAETSTNSSESSRSFAEPSNFSEPINIDDDNDDLLEPLEGLLVPCAEEAYDTYDTTYEQGPPYICNICHKEFAFKRFLAVHVKSHKNPYACSYCPKRFSERYELELHEKIHDVRPPYTCEICDMTFAFKRNLFKHFKTHF